MVTWEFKHGHRAPKGYEIKVYEWEPEHMKFALRAKMMAKKSFKNACAALKHYGLPCRDFRREVITDDDESTMAMEEFLARSGYEGGVSNALSLDHGIYIPSEWSHTITPELGNPGEPGADPPAYRYLEAYGRGWWACIGDRKNGGRCNNLGGMGWPSEADGYSAGYTAADNKVNQIIDEWGKEKTLKFLKSQYSLHTAIVNEIEKNQESQ